MMLARILPPFMAKEVRALLPLWLGALAALIGVSVLGRRIGALHSNTDVVRLLIYGGASVTLGAVSIGHEYTNRTLQLLLSQPASRARTFVVKQFVLLVMLLILAEVAWIGALMPSGGMAMAVALAVFGGLFVTPWLTMICRNPLAGAVFTWPIVGTIWLLVDASVAPPMKLVIFRWGTLGLCVVAAVLGWRTFMRLEAIEGRGGDLRWPTAAAGLAPARRRHRIWLLVKKELGLQQLTFAVAGIYVVGWAILAPQVRSDPWHEDMLVALTFLYSGLLALLIGSLASAEERHLNTVQWQLLLPMASWKQWIVKAGTALGLAMLLAVALPALLSLPFGKAIRINEWYACTVLLLTAVSLYVSSLSSSGVRALCLSVPVSFVVLFPAVALLPRLGWMGLTPFVMGVFAVTPVVLYFGLLNHRSAERGAWRIGVQVVCIAGCFAVCALLVMIVRIS